MSEKTEEMNDLRSQSSSLRPPEFGPDGQLSYVPMGPAHPEEPYLPSSFVPPVIPESYENPIVFQYKQLRDKAANRVRIVSTVMILMSIIELVFFIVICCTIEVIAIVIGLKIVAFFFKGLVCYAGLRASKLRTPSTATFFTITLLLLLILHMFTALIGTATISSDSQFIMLHGAGSIPNKLSQDLANIGISTQTLEETRAEMPYYRLEIIQISDLTENQSLRGLDEVEVDKRYISTYDYEEVVNDDHSILVGFSIVLYACILIQYIVYLLIGSKLRTYSILYVDPMNELALRHLGFPMENRNFSGLLYQGMSSNNPYRGVPPSNPYQGMPSSNPYRVEPSSNPYRSVLPIIPYQGAPIEGVSINPLVQYPYSPPSGLLNNN